MLGFGFALAAGGAGLASSAPWRNSAHAYLGSEDHAYLGYKDGVPVSAAATFTIDGCLFLARAATLPSA